MILKTVKDEQRPAERDDMTVEQEERLIQELQRLLEAGDADKLQRYQASLDGELVHYAVYALEMLAQTRVLTMKKGEIEADGKAVLIGVPLLMYVRPGLGRMPERFRNQMPHAVFAERMKECGWVGESGMVVFDDRLYRHSDLAKADIFALYHGMTRKLGNPGEAVLELPPGAPRTLPKNQMVSIGLRYLVGVVIGDEEDVEMLHNGSKEGLRTVDTQGWLKSIRDMMTDHAVMVTPGFPTLLSEARQAGARMYMESGIMQAVYAAMEYGVSQGEIEFGTQMPPTLSFRGDGGIVLQDGDTGVLMDFFLESYEDFPPSANLESGWLEVLREAGLRATMKYPSVN